MLPATLTSSPADEQPLTGPQQGRQVIERAFDFCCSQQRCILSTGAPVVCSRGGVLLLHMKAVMRPGLQAVLEHPLPVHLA